MATDTLSGTANNGTIALAWERTGPDDAVPLLLVNGLGSPLVSYEEGFVELLVAAGFVVGRFDNRDVGRSSRTTSPYDLGDMAADAVAVMDALGWPSANVFGQSMGGMIAQQLTIDAPERVRSLTSLMSGTGEPGYGRSTDEARAALLTTPPTDPEGWLANRVETERIWCSPAHWDPAWVEAKGRAMIERGVDPSGTARQYRAVAGSGSRDAALASVETTTLVMHGGADTLIDASAGRHTADVIPGARYVEIAELGHDLPPALWPRIVDEVAVFAGLAP